MKISLSFTPKQERYLLQLGIAALADQAIGSPVAKRQSGGQKWTPAQRRKFIATMAKVRAHKQRKGKANGHALMNGTAQAGTAKGIAIRADGKPLKQPGKRWTAAHRRNFVKAYKKTMAEKRAKAAAAAAAGKS